MSIASNRIVITNDPVSTCSGSYAVLTMISHAYSYKFDIFNNLINVLWLMIHKKINNKK